MAQELHGMSTVADVIRAHYEVGAVDRPRPFEGTHQRRHRKMVVDTGKGRFLVKTYHADVATLDALAFQHRLAGHLARQGLPVAEIQRTREGRGIVVVDDWALELQRFVEGEAMRVGDRTLRVSANALGKFHEACRDFPAPPRDARMWRFSEVPRASFEGFYKRARAERDTPELTDQCNRIALFLHGAAEALSFQRRNQFETGLIHGDWHGGNLLFRGEELAAILDLEFAGMGCYLEDLAYAVSNLCVRTTENPEKMRVRTELLLDAYEDSRTLSPVERIALYYAVGVKHVTTVCYQSVQQGGTVAGLTCAQWMARLDAQCAWLGDTAERLRWGR